MAASKEQAAREGLSLSAFVEKVVRGIVERHQARQSEPGPERKGAP
ncbi:MAG: hypothetical protein KIS68_10765 [Bauldia sp.]|nr:hypothetical protein [Bauldia sp.]